MTHADASVGHEARRLHTGTIEPGAVARAEIHHPPLVPALLDEAVLA